MKGLVDFLLKILIEKAWLILVAGVLLAFAVFVFAPGFLKGVPQFFFGLVDHIQNLFTG